MTAPNPKLPGVADQDAGHGRHHKPPASAGELFKALGDAIDAGKLDLARGLMRALRRQGFSVVALGRGGGR